MGNKSFWKAETAVSPGVNLERRNFESLGGISPQPCLSASLRLARRPLVNDTNSARTQTAIESLKTAACASLQ